MNRYARFRTDDEKEDKDNLLGGDNPIVENLRKKAEKSEAPIHHTFEVSPIEKEHLTNRIKGLSKEEMDIVADALPNEILILSLVRRMDYYEDVIAGLNELVNRLSDD